MPSRWRLWCNDEAAHVGPVIHDSPPTSCPNDALHVLDEGKTIQLDSATHVQWLAYLGQTSPAPPLATYQQAKIGALAEDVTVYLQTAYDPNNQISLLMLLLLTVDESTRPNRRVHVRQAATWAELVLSEYSSKVASVQAATSIAAVDAIQYDWPTFEASNPDPAITLSSAMAITD